MGIIATILSQQGYQVKVIDNNSQYKHYSNKDLLNTIKRDQPDVVAFSIVIPNAYETYQLIGQIKCQFPHLPIVAGGIHMKHSFKEALMRKVDIVVNRDGEKVVGPLFSHLESKNKINIRSGLDKIPGISFIKNDKTLFVSEDHATLDNLDDVPIIDYSLFNMDDYIKTKREPGLFFVTGQRGCPFHCTFCSDEVQRGDKRNASPNWMFQNVKYLYEKYNAHYIILADNNFTFPRARAIELCNMLIESGLNKKISFSCQTKVETPLDEELLKLMKKAGIIKVGIGLERLDPFSLKMIKKNSSKERVHKVLTSLKKMDMKVGIFMIVGFPFETMELLNSERKYFLELIKYTETFNCSILQPTPGTIYYESNPRSQEWYLEKKAFQKWRAYYSNVLEAYMLAQIDQNFFRLSPEILQEIKKIYLEFKNINYGTYFSKKSSFLSLMLKLDRVIANCSYFFFKFSPNCEFWLFSKVRSLRYYLGTALFGENVLHE